MIDILQQFASCQVSVKIIIFKSLLFLSFSKKSSSSYKFEYTLLKLQQRIFKSKPLIIL